MQNNTFIDKVAALVLVDKKLLMTWEKSKGYYLFPGGKRENGESDIRCLERELGEELEGVKIVGSPIYYQMYSGKHDGRAIMLTAYIVKLDGNPKPKEEKITDLVYVNTSNFDELSGKMTQITHQVFKHMLDQGLIN